MRNSQPAALWAACLVAATMSGCAPLGLHSPPAQPLAAPLPNPLLVPAMDHEHLWQQVVDTVDDYFTIAREERIRTDGGVVTDGRIHTHPQTGATCLEPWRPDSTTAFEKTHCTLQSIRKYAEVRVSPSEQGFAVEVLVYKELEDVSQPEHATVGASTLRYDDSLVRNDSPARSGPMTLGWEPLGRDAFLEQRILAELQGRLAGLPATNRLPVLSP